MVSKRLVLPSTFTGSGPVLDFDPVIASTGALLLVDYAHPQDPVTYNNAALVDGIAFPNLAYDRFKALYPAAVEASSAVNLTRGAGAVSPHAAIERTAKGGVHLAFCTENAGDVTRSARLVIGSSIRAYLAANSGHSYFFSIWGRVTREAQHARWTTGAIPPLAAIPAADASLASFYTRASSWPSSGTTVLPDPPRKVGHRQHGALGADSSTATGATDTGPLLSNVGVSSMASSTVASAYIARGGSDWDFLGAFPSMVSYRAYIEDLTVSGRTYGQVDALDWAAYQAEVLTAGGRYFGDTFTAPTTLT